MSLLPVADAQARLLALAAHAPEEIVPLAEAAGRWLSAPVDALIDRPFADVSAMDGFALRFSDLHRPLRVIGESVAGTTAPAAIAPGEALRIFTGAPMPAGADTVLIQEEATLDGAQVLLTGRGPSRPGAHVRPRATDFAAGARLLDAGERVTPAVIGLAAGAGHGALPVRRRVRIAILSTGDELVAPGTPAPPGALPSSNAAMLAALLDIPACSVVDHGIVRDDLEAITSALTAAALDADIVVTSGGASVGDRDLVRPAILAAGGSIDFWRIAMRPGKPLTAGRIGDAVMIGLPGNPVSALVTAMLFVAPLAAHIAGAADPLPRTLRAPLSKPLPANDLRQDYVRASLIDGALMTAVAQDSGHLGVLAKADALIVRAPYAAAAEAGEIVEYLPLDRVRS